MSAPILEDFLMNYVEAAEGVVEQNEAGIYTILYGSDPSIKTVTFEIEVAKENPQAELFLPGSSFFDAIIRDATTKGRICSTYLSGLQTVMKVIQSESARVFSFTEHRKGERKKIETGMSSFLPYNFKVWTFIFRVRITTDVIEEHIYAVSVDARTLKLVKNFVEYLDKFRHTRNFEENISDFRLHDVHGCYPVALEFIKQKLGGLFRRKRQEALSLKNRELERVGKYYESLIHETEEALAKKGGDKQMVTVIQEKQRAILLQKQAAVNDIEFRHKMGVSMSLVSALVTNYPCYVSRMRVPLSPKVVEFDIIWNPLFKRFEPLVCPACKNYSYTLNILRSHMLCQACFTDSCPTFEVSDTRKKDYSGSKK